MSTFDPYHTWLGIPTTDQPPNHYRLLGVELFEANADVIDAAANRLTTYLQSLTVPGHERDCQAILSQIVEARQCLLNAESRTAYDDQLSRGATAKNSVVSQSVMISNGVEFFEIPQADLAAATADGFYVPSDRGCVLVTDGNEILEIPVADLEDAQAEGFAKLSSLGQETNNKTSLGSPQQMPPLMTAPRQLGPRDIGVSGPTTAPGLTPVIESGAAVELVDANSLSIETSEPEIDPVDAREVAISTGKPDVTPLQTEALQDIAVEEVVDEDAEHRAALEDELEEATGMQRWKLLFALHAPSQEQVNKFSRTYGLSTLLHIVVLILFSLIIFQSADKEDGGVVISSTISAAEELVNDEETPVEMTQETDVAESANESPDLAGEISTEVGAFSGDLVSNLNAGDLGGGLDGAGADIGKAVKASASFFGSKSVASRFVFVIDNSNSMTKGRFETALNELSKTLDTLNKDQFYYIIFYSDTAYGLFHPRTTPNLIPATKKNKLATLQWLLSVQLCLRTDCADALEAAYRLKPDVIFMLGDGAFTDVQAVRQVMARRTDAQKKIKINTLGMEVNAGAAKNFIDLATTTGGKYNDVGVHPKGAALAKQAPRRRNNKRGPVWGITLPAK